MSSCKIRKNVNSDEWPYYLFLCREARALILKDAESFHEAAIALEQIGRMLMGRIANGLGGYKDVLLELMTEAGKNNITENERLFDVIKDARNMSVHEGAIARHLSTRLSDIFLIIEEAIMMKVLRVGDIMVRNPVVAESWQMISQARREMLSNSFSCLPIFHHKK